MSRALSRSAGSSSSASSAVESAGELVIPSCGPAAQVGNPWFIKPEPRPPAVREDAHPQHEQRGRRDVHAGQEPTGKPVQPADSPRNQVIDVPLRPVLRQRGGLLGHHGGGGAFREPETWAICRSNRAVGWS